MMSFIKRFKVAFLLTTLLMILHFTLKDFTNKHQRPIAGDAMGYYAYLPAIFIYHDLDYKFAKKMDEKYYPPGYGKSFVKEAPNGEKVNKTFPGISLLYAPFFALAHSASLIFGLEADGYSNVYQFFYLIGFWTYFLLGLIFFFKVLIRMGFEEKKVNLATVILVLGTNIFFYSVFDQSVTHVHNFFMINAAIYCLMLFKEHQNYKHLGIAIFLLALIGITRPTNILVLPLLIFFFPEKEFYRLIWMKIKRPVNTLKTFSIAMAIIMIPLSLWKAQTGNWLVYSYVDEGFSFADPHFSEFIFSYLKGWLVYTPIALMIIVPALILLFLESRAKAFFVLGFYLVSIYFFSSWWCWYYGAGMGQRVMIDHYILLGFLLLLVLKFIEDRKFLKTAMLSVCLLLMGLNVIQAFQIRYGIIPMGTPTKMEYWDNFLNFKKKAKVYPKENWKLRETIDFDLNPQSRYLQTDNTLQLIDDNWTIHVSDYYNYSGVLLSTSEFLPISELIVSFNARARTETESSRIIVTIGSEGNSEQRIFNFSTHLIKDEWTEIEFLIEPRSTYNQVELYFWNGGSSEKVEFRDIKIYHYHVVADL
ncbi:hypothetical protein JYT72_00685 [Crocinitomix catalasitica]|nr:hypothetical protein [Crocinitomix catalasitica]